MKIEFANTITKRLSQFRHGFLVARKEAPARQAGNGHALRLFGGILMAVLSHDSHSWHSFSATQPLKDAL